MMTGSTHMKESDIFRQYIELVEDMHINHEPIKEITLTPEPGLDILSEIDDLIFKLNNHESGMSGDRAIGFDEGIQLAVRVLSAFRNKIEVSYDDNQSNI